jgi:gephyrin
VVTKWCDPESSERVDLLLTSGGTGFGLRDLTPEAIRPVLHREAPGVAQALLNEGLKHTPLAVLSRPVVGTRHASLVCTLPGSVKAVRENIVCLKALLPRIMELLKEGESSHVQPYANAPGQV